MKESTKIKKPLNLLLLVLWVFFMLLFTEVVTVAECDYRDDGLKVILRW